MGDERFLAAIQRKRHPTPQIILEEGPVPFPHVPRAVAERQRPLVAPRRVLVFAAGTWIGITMTKLGQTLQQDPSMLSRPYASISPTAR